MKAFEKVRKNLHYFDVRDLKLLKDLHKSKLEFSHKKGKKLTSLKDLR